MAKILYSGKDAVGKKIVGYIEADDNAEALAALTARRVTDVLFYTEGASALPVPIPDGLSERENAERVRRQISIRRNPGFLTFFNNHFSITNTVIFVGAVVLLWALVYRNTVVLAGGLAFELTIVAIAYRAYQRLGRYLRFQKAYARGQWDTALKLAARLRTAKAPPNLLHQLVFKEACIAVKRGSLSDGLAVLERGQKVTKDMTPALYASSLGTLYATAGDYKEALKRYREAAEKSPKSQVFRLDWAMAEARFGDVNRAQQIVAGVSKKELPHFAKPFYDFVHGVIARRRGDPNALTLLKVAYAAQSKLKSQPATRLVLDACTAHYALALYDAGEKLQADRLLRGVWSTLKHHVDNPLRVELAQRFSFARAG